jgi:hypothetical protein
VAAAALDHAGHERAGELERCPEVDVERAVDLLGGELGDGPAGRERGVGHQHVDGAGALGERGHAAGLGQVSRQRQRTPAERGGDLVELVRAPAADQQSRAASVERAGDRLADAAGRAGEEHCRAVYVHRRRSYPTRACSSASVSAKARPRVSGT